MTDAGLDLTACDREPIHIPGSIQPHGMLLVADRTTRAVVQAAGEGAGWLGRADFTGAQLAEVIGDDLAERAFGLSGTGEFLGEATLSSGRRADVSVRPGDDGVIIELEPAPPEPLSATAMLAGLEAAAASFERATTLRALCDRAAIEFRRLTGYDRVMVYQFLDEGAGAVLAEDRRPDLRSFLNHHFPASDIPRQARALYIRNPVRVIPDINYEPAPLRPASAGRELDMSDCILRSVSPIHLRYLANMGVRASASISIVKDGALWGLIACHNETPRPIPYDVRAACRALGGSLVRQIKAKEESESYRERIRLLGLEDEMVALLSREGSLEAVIMHHLGDVARMLGGDGVAILRGPNLITHGACPSETDIRQLAAFVTARTAEAVFATDRLQNVYPGAQAFQAVASGALAIVLSAEEPWVVLWFRAEEVEVINWAGNPHKRVETDPAGALTPRASFEAWRETVRGRSRRWTIPEVEAAARLRTALLDVRRNRQLRELNRQLIDTLQEKELLLEQKQFLINEVNHRVQNSLQLVSSFLALQARASADPALHAALDEARRRLSAVALVHRRLYRADQIEVIDAARYVQELCAEVMASLGEEWTRALSLDLAPVMLPADRAVTLGLVLTELVINANKYAYGGAPGPLDISLVEDRAKFRLRVADQGRGKTTATQGFGSRMLDALVAQLGGELEFADNRPGLRATLTAPIEPRPAMSGRRSEPAGEAELETQQ